MRGGREGKVNGRKREQREGQGNTLKRKYRVGWAYQSGEAIRFVTTLRVERSFDAPSTPHSRTCLAAICNRVLSLAMKLLSRIRALIWSEARSLLVKSVASAMFCHSSSLSTSSSSGSLTFSMFFFFFSGNCFRTFRASISTEGNSLEKSFPIRSVRGVGSISAGGYQNATKMI